MFRNKSVNVHQFAMVPRADIPRSSFRMQKILKTTFDSGFLVPVMCEEVLPGDTFNCKMTTFCRMATPIFPVMDNMYLDSFFFFVPNRLVWDNWQKFMGEQVNPGDSTSFSIPQMNPKMGGYDIGSLYDHFGLPTAGQVDPAGYAPHSSLPIRAYALIFNEWFRDENLVDSVHVDHDDGNDAYTDYSLLRRGKRHDYFTSCLPWTQKGAAVSIPLGSTAVVTTGTVQTNSPNPLQWAAVSGGGYPAANTLQVSGGLGHMTVTNTPNTADGSPALIPLNLYADLSTATAATINQLRQSFQVQKLLERDARGGTRYTEIVRSHFGVVSPDARLQRPEYLGGGSNAISINPVAQTSATTATGSDTPLGTLAAFGHGVGHNHGFSKSFVEHGYIIGLVNVRADLTYQQGMRRHWSRLTRYDFYFPVFSHLGEQAVLRKEIYTKGTTDDEIVFGYQERWAEYRYNPSEIHGLFRSTASGTIDAWHLAQKFGSAPVLDETFIQENPPVDRIVAVGDDANGQQFLMDAFFDIKAARPMPMYSVPGLIDHF